MTDTTLNRGEAIQKNEWGASHWVKRTVAVTFCLGLLVTLGVVFTHVIAARVPEQRATLEKLITDRTGLEVRFDNVRFAWDLDGTSAVFTRVELTDPERGRVHVRAPELRVELDTWDFLRHHQFSLGHVTLVSPDIEIIGDPEESLVQVVAPRAVRAGQPDARADEATVVNRYLGWAGLMPSGRIEVEGARVHLRRRGPPGTRHAPAHSFTLSQAVVSRAGGTFSAYGTMLLTQDIGQSLFVSAKLDGLDAGKGLSGDLRFIARRVFLEKLDVGGLRGRGTLDARLALKDGRVASGSWQASARELSLDDGTRFDHVTVNGRLSRAAHAVLLDLTDLQLTRGARLERAPRLEARIELEPGSVKIARTMVRAERIPFMAAEFVAGLLAPQTSHQLPAMPGGWIPSAGELHALRFDSGERRKHEAWKLSAQVARLELSRAVDHARLAPVSGRVTRDASGLTLAFDANAAATLRLGAGREPRAVQFDGRLVLLPGEGGWRFEQFAAASGPARFSADGAWQPAARRAAPLRVALAQVDQSLLRDLWNVVAGDSVVPEPWSRIEQGVIHDGSVELVASEDGAVNWSRSRGAMTLAQLATTGNDVPRLAGTNGKLNFARGGVQLKLESGSFDDLDIAGARLEWPRSGAPRLHALLEGQMESRLLRAALQAQGLEQLRGAVSLEVDARGERELRRPELWRFTARVSGATVPLAGALPPVEKLSGTIRYSAQQLRSLSLQGNWLGGPVEIESRRAGNRGAAAFAINGTADAGPLLELLGGAEAAGRVSGQFAWDGTVQPGAEAGTWQVTLGSSLAGVESHLPAPFGKPRARHVPVSAELRVGPEGVREFDIDGRELTVRGQVRAGAARARFEVQGISGELQRSAGRGANPQLEVQALDLARAPALLAASGALLPVDGELALRVEQLRHGDHDLGVLQASIVRQDDGMDFSLDTPATAVHQLSARGRCAAGNCRAEFSADTTQLATLLNGVQLPAEWPASSLRASGSLEWPVDAADVTRALAGSFDLSAQGADAGHQLSARARLADGQILLADVQGAGPESDQVFRGSGRISLVARNYDLTMDYERVALAATAMPSPARARFARAWNAVRGSAARHGWTEAPETRRIQWHGTWD